MIAYSTLVHPAKKPPRRAGLLSLVQSVLAVGRRCQRFACVLAPCAVLLFTGCKHLGPRTVSVDRFDYSTAIADSWKQQTLLNIVKLRYLDLPVFVDVASIVSGYSMQTGVSVGGTLSSQNAIQGDFASLGGHAIYTDRPTVTYVPMTGEKFLRSPTRRFAGIRTRSLSTAVPCSRSCRRSPAT
jgi:hypothetical protein